MLKRNLIIHQNSVYGVSWNPFLTNRFATGWDDGSIRVIDLSEGVDTDKIDILKGHRDRVFNIAWHPHSQNILASGSNDFSIRVWNVESKESIELKGHTNFVRGLVWNYEIPWFLASGSWDAQIRIWDTRIGACITVLDDHHADIYGLDAHPDRPFVYASWSRDNSIRFWNSEGLITNFKIQSILRYQSSELVGDANESMIIGDLGNNDGSTLNLSLKNKMWGTKSKKIFENVDYEENK